nr:MAG TPA: hypothetical protein [Caudoviricetes sp.]
MIIVSISYNVNIYFYILGKLCYYVYRRYTL